MFIKSFFLRVSILVLISSPCLSHHKIGHSGGKGDGGGYGGCYSGNGPNTSGSPQCELRVVKVSDLGFQTVVAGFSQSVITFPGDTQAAAFDVLGVPCSRIKVEIVNDPVEMRANGASVSDSITATNFTFGGSLSGSGTAVTNCSTGELNNIRVGGTARIGASNLSSSYIGTPMIRVLYY